MRVFPVVFCIIAAAAATGSAQDTQGAAANDFGGTYESSEARAESAGRRLDEAIRRSHPQAGGCTAGLQ